MRIEFITFLESEIYSPTDKIWFLIWLGSRAPVFRWHLSPVCRDEQRILCDDSWNHIPVHAATFVALFVCLCNRQHPRWQLGNSRRVWWRGRKSTQGLDRSWAPTISPQPGSYCELDFEKRRRKEKIYQEG